jgi:hypothetical protein
MSDNESDTGSNATQPYDDEFILYSPISYVECAVAHLEGEADRIIILFDYVGHPRSAFYASSGTSMNSGLKGTYLPFYGETNKFLKASDVRQPNDPREGWKKILIEHPDIKKLKLKKDFSFFKYFKDFFELQISASIDSKFWKIAFPEMRSFVLSHSFNEETGTFVSEPLDRHIGTTDTYRPDLLGTGGCFRLKMETGDINNFLKDQGVEVDPMASTYYHSSASASAPVVAASASASSASINEPLQEKGGKRLKRQTRRKGRKGRKGIGRKSRKGRKGRKSCKRN